MIHGGTAVHRKQGNIGSGFSVKEMIKERPGSGNMV